MAAVKKYGTYKMSGIPIMPGDAPYYGNGYFVDGTNGLNSNAGDHPKSAKKDIQDAVTLQIANNTGLGDKITIFPGTYAENLTGDLTDVQLVGAFPHAPDSVQVTPVAGNAYQGTLTRAVIRNMAFYKASSTLKDYAAISMPDMTDSLIDNCHIVSGAAGTGQDDLSTGIRIGTEVSAADWESMFRSKISNCLIGHKSSTLYNFKFGIVFGVTNVATGATYNNHRQFSYSEICYNNIYVEKDGIQLNMGGANNSGGMIHHNQIGCAHAHGDLSRRGISFPEGDDQLTKIYHNIISADAAIYGFEDNNVYMNIISEGKLEPATQYPDTT